MNTVNYNNAVQAWFDAVSPLTMDPTLVRLQYVVLK